MKIVSELDAGPYMLQEKLKLKKRIIILPLVTNCQC